MNTLLIPKIIGFSLAFLLFIVASFRVTQFRHQRQVDSQAAVGLALALLCWSSIPILLLVQLRFDLPQTFLVLWNIIVWIAMIVAICFALLRLFDFSGIGQRKKNTQQLAWQTLGLAFLFAITTGSFLLNPESGFIRRLMGEKPEKRELLTNFSFNEKYNSENFYYTVLGAGSTWDIWKDFASEHRYADFGLRHDDSAYFVVMPFVIEEGVPDHELFVKAATPMVDVHPEQPWQGKFERHQQNGFQGYVFDFEQKVQQSSYSYKMKTLTNDRLGYVITAWSDHEDPQHREGLLNNILNRTQLTFQTGADLPPMANFTKREMRRQGKIYENIGHEFLKAGDYENSLKYFEGSGNFQDQNAAVLGSVLYAYLNQEKVKAAKDYLAKYLDRFPEGSHLYEMLEQREAQQLSSPGPATPPRGEVPEHVVQELIEAFGELPVFEYGDPDLDSMFDFDHPEGWDDYDYTEEASASRVERQDNPFQRIQPSSQASSSDVSKQQNLGAINKSLIRKIYFEPNQVFRNEETKRLQITTHEGALSFQYLYFPFDKSRQEIKVESVAILNSSMTEKHKPNPKTFYVIEGAGVHAGKEVVNIPLPSLQVGDVIETKVVWTQKTPVAQMDYFEYSFATEYESHLHQFIFVGDVESITHKSTRDLEAQELSDQVTWTYNQEDASIPSTQVTARVWLGDANKSWAGEAKKVMEAMQAFSKGHREIAAISRRMTASVESAGDRIKMLADYAHQGFKLDPQPMRADQLIRPHEFYDFSKTESMDSLFHALYFQKLLQGVSVDSYLALIRKDGVLQMDIPSLQQFDYALLFIPSAEKNPFWDVANKEQKPGQMGASLKGLEALVLDRKKPGFVRIR